MRIERTNMARACGTGLAAAVVLTLAVATAQPATATQSVSASVASDTLTVVATNADDRVALRLGAGSPGTLHVDFDDDGVADQSFDRSTFSRIHVSLRAGDDHFRVDQLNGAFADESLTVDGGNGNDLLDGGDGAEVFSAGNGADTVDGNRGADIAHMGNGRDVFIWDPGDGSDVVEGDNGSDTLDFNGAPNDELFRLSPNGNRSLFFRQQGTILMDMDGVERLDLTTLDGVDTVTVNDMSGTDFRQVAVDLAGATGAGDARGDIMTLEGTAGADRVKVRAADSGVAVHGLATDVRITGSETIDQLRINTGDGNDSVDVDGAVSSLISATVDLGPGQS
jgi:RTX calcium-binding nonapeptide repeat (4 copies)